MFRILHILWFKFHDIIMFIWQTTSTTATSIRLSMFFILLLSMCMLSHSRLFRRFPFSLWLLSLLLFCPSLDICFCVVGSSLDIWYGTVAIIPSPMFKSLCTHKPNNVLYHKHASNLNNEIYDYLEINPELCISRVSDGMEFLLSA